MLFGLSEREESLLYVPFCSYCSLYIVKEHYYYLIMFNVRIPVKPLGAIHLRAWEGGDF